ncbi:hypothetical protein DL95DRAFT_433585 [Leptodontidium sp. 2 PMI_412]|nr:hypothetical protein DL95DRAFT_433585 [Leptodontidium sp. 2 PMI_412]
MDATEKPLQIDFGSDEQEIHRLTIQHEVTKSAFPSLILAPIDLSQPCLKILDSATADGLWLRDIQSLVATPHSCIGTDINPNVFPASPTEDIAFQVQDITKPWPAELAGEFSLVHSRNGLAGCGAFPVSEAVKNLVGLLKPGGWIQIEEMDFQRVKDIPGALHELADLLDAMFSAVGAHWGYASQLEEWLVEAGLVDVEVKVIDVPYGKACVDGDIAKKSVYAFVLGAKAVCIGAKALQVQGFTNDQLETLPERLGKYLVEVGAKGPMVCVWGRKPL